MCQLHLSTLLREEDPVQSFAWLQIAAGEGLEQASHLIRPEAARLSREQIDSAGKLREHILRTTASNRL
jgi:hypothetical protein